MDVGRVVALDLLAASLWWPTRLADSAPRRLALCGPTLNRGRLLRSRPASVPYLQKPQLTSPDTRLGEVPPGSASGWVG